MFVVSSGVLKMLTQIDNDYVRVNKLKKSFYPVKGRKLSKFVIPPITAILK